MGSGAPVSPRCRGCDAALTETFVDLGTAPPSNAYLEDSQLAGPETYFPLKAYVCAACYLVQLPAYQSPSELFSEYAYFSSYAKTWMDHARAYAAGAIERYSLDARSFVVEIASNDGYLLRNFVVRGIPVLGIEPAENVAAAARASGVPTDAVFFGRAVAERMLADGFRPDLVIANNVLAHVPDLHDFLAGLAILLGSGGVATIEFPHLLELIEGVQFDTIYHEHFSYFSAIALEPALAKHGLVMSDVELLTTHGGSLRLEVRTGSHASRGERPSRLIERERAAGLDRLETYRTFDRRVRECKGIALQYLLEAQRAGKRVAAYGAPAKGNTFLNYCGIRADLVAYTADLNPYKQGRYLPGSRIPIYSPDHIAGDRPDVLLVLPWNLLDEIVTQLSFAREWNVEFVTAIPTLTVRR